jgi:hypothetical protein
MRYSGPGVAPADIEVEESEVQDLENTGVWSKSKSKKTLEETQKEQEEKEEGN